MGAFPGQDTIVMICQTLVLATELMASIFVTLEQAL